MNLLEYIISHTIILGLSVSILSLFPTMKNINEVTTDSIEETTDIISIDSLFEGVMNELDSHRYPLPPLIHKNGEIHEKSGELSLLMIGDDEDLPHKESDAITAISLKPVKPLRVVREENNLISICRNKADDEIHGLAYTGDTLFEVIGIKNELSINSDCSTYLFSIPEKSIFFIQPQEKALERVRIILPIDAIYTLYLRSDLTFRYVQHKGGEIRENQPIMSIGYPLKITQTDGYSLNIEIIKNEKTIFKKEYHPTLGRLPLERTLLQQWRLSS